MLGRRVDVDPRRRHRRRRAGRHPPGPRLLPAQQAGGRRDDRQRPAGPADRPRARAPHDHGCSRSGASTVRPRACSCSRTTASSPSCSPTRSHGVEKEYLAEVAGVPSPAAIRRLRDGVVARRRRDHGAGQGGGRLARRAPDRRSTRAATARCGGCARRSAIPSSGSSGRASGRSPTARFARAPGGRSRSRRCGRSPQAALRSASSPAR